MYEVRFKDGSIVKTTMTHEQRRYCIQMGAISIKKIVDKK